MTTHIARAEFIKELKTSDATLANRYRNRIIDHHMGAISSSVQTTMASLGLITGLVLVVLITTIFIYLGIGIDKAYVLPAMIVAISVFTGPFFVFTLILGPRRAERKVNEEEQAILSMLNKGKK